MELLFKEITHKIIGCAMEVHRVLGPGFQEYIYHRALAIEMRAVGLKIEEEFELPVFYKGDQIGLRKVDFRVENTISVEIKAKSDLDNNHLAQAINYIEASNIPAGLLVNFGTPSLQFKRLHNKTLFPADKSVQL